MPTSRTRSLRTASVLSLLLAAAATASAQTVTITQLAREGDSIGGLGTVSFANPTAVNNSGAWLASFDLANAVITPNFVAVRDGAVYLQGGQTLDQPGGGSTFSRLGIYNTNINNNGNSAGFFNLAGVASANNSGLYWNADRLLLQKGISIADMPGLTPGIPYIGFFGSRLNDNNQVLFIGTVDDPAINSSVDRVLVRLDYNPTAQTFTQHLIAKEGDFIEGDITVADFSTSANNYDLNNAGDALYCPTSGSTIQGIFKNSTAIALLNDTSPIPGRTYAFFPGTCALNNTGAGGGHVFLARLSGDTSTDTVLIRGDEVFVQEGDTVDGKTIVEFGTGAPVLIDDAGNVVWYGRWSTSGARVGGLFRNHRLILEDGVTTVNNGADTIKNVRWISEAFSMSDNGRFILARVIHQSASGEHDATLKIEIGGSSCPADADGNGQIEPADVATFVSTWFTSIQQGTLAGDFDNNGAVEPSDVAAFVSAWFTALTTGCD